MDIHMQYKHNVCVRLNITPRSEQDSALHHARGPGLRLQHLTQMRKPFGHRHTHVPPKSVFLAAAISSVWSTGPSLLSSLWSYYAGHATCCPDPLLEGSTSQWNIRHSSKGCTFRDTSPRSSPFPDSFPAKDSRCQIWRLGYLGPTQRDQLWRVSPEPSCPWPTSRATSLFLTLLFPFIPQAGPIASLVNILQPGAPPQPIPGMWPMVGVTLFISVIFLSPR